MAYECPVFMLPGFVSSADYSASTNQYKFVMLHSTANQIVMCSATTDKPIGVLQNTPSTGEEAEVMVIGVTKVQADASIALNAVIGTSGDGQAEAKTGTTEYACGVCIGIAGAGNAGQIATAIINCLPPQRAGAD